MNANTCKSSILRAFFCEKLFLFLCAGCLVTFANMSAHAAEQVMPQDTNNVTVVKKPPYKTITYLNGANPQGSGGNATIPSSTITSNTIESSDVAPIKRADFGLKEPVYGDNFVLNPVDSKWFITTAEAIPDRIHLEVIRDLWASLLAQPRGTALDESLPKNWQAQTLQRLDNMGKADVIDALINIVPPALYDETLHRYHVRKLITDAKFDEVCKVTDEVLQSSITTQDALWDALHIQCLRAENKQTEADIALSVMTEQHPEYMTILLDALLQGEETKNTMLPEMKEADAEVSSILLASQLLNQSRREQILARIPSNFLAHVTIEKIPAVLARELTAAPKLSLEKRVLLAENAMRSGLVPAVVVRTLYHTLVVAREAETEKLKASKISESSLPITPALERALAYEQITTTAEQADKARMLAEILPLFTENMPISQAGEIFAAEFAVLSQGGYTTKDFPMSVAFLALRHHLSHHYDAAAIALRNTLQQGAQSSSNESLLLTAAIAEQAIRLHDVSEGKSLSAPVVALPVLKPNSTRTDAWAVMRTIAVLRALGYDVDHKVEDAIKHIEAAETIPLDDALRVKVDAIFDKGTQADKMLAVLAVLDTGRLDIVSDETIAVAIENLRAAGLVRAAFALARDAILLPPQL